MPPAGTQTGRERVARAMCLAVPDRVPVFCQLAMGHYFLNSGLAPVDIWFRSEAFADALVGLQQRYRFDGILVNLPGRDPDFERHVDRVERDDEAKQTLLWWRGGCHTRIPDDDNPQFFSTESKNRNPSLEGVDPGSLWYVEPWDLTAVNYPYTWGFDATPRPFDEFFPAYHADSIRLVKAKVGDSVSVHSEVFSPFSQLLELLNYESALMGLIVDPDKVHAILARLTLGAIDLGRRQAALGVDAVLISSAFAGAGLISREHYSTFVLPYERQLIEGIRADYPDLKIYTHTCGAIGDRLDLMLTTGTDGIDTLDPPPLGTVELDVACEQLGGRAFLKGNIDSVNTLLRGDPAAVERAVEQRMRIAKPGGGWILSSACSVAPAVPPENLHCLVETAWALGGYD